MLLHTEFTTVGWLMLEPDRKKPQTFCIFTVFVMSKQQDTIFSIIQGTDVLFCFEFGTRWTYYLMWFVLRFVFPLKHKKWAKG